MCVLYSHDITNEKNVQRESEITIKVNLDCELSPFFFLLKINYWLKEIGPEIINLFSELKWMKFNLLDTFHKFFPRQTEEE